MGPVINSRTAGIHLDISAFNLFLFLGLGVIKFHVISIGPALFLSKFIRGRFEIYKDFLVSEGD